MNTTELQTASTQADAHLSECENAMMAARNLAIRTLCKQRDLAFCHDAGLLAANDFELGAVSELAQKTAAEYQLARRAWLDARADAATAHRQLTDALNEVKHAKAA